MSVPEFTMVVFPMFDVRLLAKGDVNVYPLLNEFATISDINGSLDIRIGGYPKGQVNESVFTHVHNIRYPMTLFAIEFINFLSSKGFVTFMDDSYTEYCFAYKEISLIFHESEDFEYSMFASSKIENAFDSCFVTSHSPDDDMIYVGITERVRIDEPSDDEE